VECWLGVASIWRTGISDEEQCADAGGLISSNVCVDEDLSAVDHHSRSC
jgi:hypothetical protein